MPDPYKVTADPTSSPDFILKKANGRERKLIFDVYIGNKDLREMKGKYKKLDFFADFMLVTQYNFASQLEQ